MIAFRDFSIRVKLLVIVLSSVFVSLFIASSAIVIINHKVAIQEFKDQLKILVDITAERSQAGLAFNDRRVVKENLVTLSKLESIDLACMYSKKGGLFSSYARAEGAYKCSRLLDQDASIGVDSDIITVTELYLNQHKIGSLYVYANTKSLDQRLLQFLATTALIILFSGFIAYIMAIRLQRELTLPIIRLSKMSRLIGKTHDFSLRARVLSKDETGLLAKEFNGLISTIQDSQIQMQELVLELQEKSRQLEFHAELVEDRNKVIRNIFAGASHDLRQPLQAMSLFVDALKNTIQGKELDLVHNLDLSIQNMQKLFNEFLDVSKLESHLDKVQHGAIELKPLLDGVYNEFDMLAQDKKIQLRFYSRDYVIDSNAGMLERIIRNLLSNAIRYTSDGGILLACRKRQNHILIEVWDTGRGIPEASMNSIFNRFYQVENTSIEGKQGYGLGLSIVKRLSERLKHPVEIKSTLGRGTLFRVKVPLFDDVRLEALPRAGNTLTPISEPVYEGAFVELLGYETRILLIDDDDLVRDGLLQLMVGWGMTVLAFDSITAMGSYLVTNDDVIIDIIVSDFQLSETETGLDAIAVAKHHLGENLPALIITGTQDPNLLQIIKDSAFRKLAKPVKAAKLRALINHLIVQESKQ